MEISYNKAGIVTFHLSMRQELWQGMMLILWILRRSN